MTTAVTATLNAAGQVSGTFTVDPGRTATATVANTFAGRVVLQRKLSSAGWEDVAAFYAAGVVTISTPGDYRLVMTKRTSGQADVTLDFVAVSGGGVGTAALTDTIGGEDAGNPEAPERYTLQQVYDLILANLPADAAAGTAALRSLGTTATKAAAGNDSRLSDARTPSNASVTDAKLAAGAGPALTKPAVALVAAANVALTGEQTIDGVLTSASLVLCTAQTASAENGPWLTGAGAWTRPVWYASGSTVLAPQFLTTFVRLGTTYQGSTWRMTTANVTIDTTATTWVQTPIAIGNLATIAALSLLGNAGGSTGAVAALNGATAKALLNTLLGFTAGTFTATGYTGTNTDAVTGGAGFYVQIGDLVLVAGTVSIDATASGAVTAGLSIPVASNFADATSAFGIATQSVTAGQSAGKVLSDSTNKRFQILFNTSDTANRAYNYIAIYRVVP